MTSRRNFLHKLTVTAIGFPLIHTANAITEQAMFPVKEGPVLRVALMGLGSYANRVAEAMQQCKRAKITGLISGTPQKLRDWGSRFSVPEQNRYSYENFHRIRDNKDIDAIYVITPNALHYENTIEAARAGKHVICEKPMALNAKQAQEMIDACKKAGVHLLIGYRMHFEPKTLEVVRMRKNGAFGKILYFEGLSGFRIGNPGQWRLSKELAGGGAMMDIGIYSINGARYMVGEEPTWVTAQETKTNPEKFKNGVDETITFQLGFPGGAIASCLSTYNMNNLDRFFLNGEIGHAELQPATGYGPIKGRTHQGELTQPHITHQTIQMDEMAAIILDGKKPEVPVDGAEGLKDMKIIDAIYEAVKSGKKVALTL
ncbi:MAG TPA: Gfo/Idh/MocA family oxidoreductase [Flavisolibacter sp.]|nr:Gfo/Idh/MocA family oxidoreductase [Flavisolibacter sp.]